MSVLMLVLHCLVYYSFVDFQIAHILSPPTFFFLFKILLTIRNPLQFCMNFTVSFPFLQKKKKKTIEILIENTLNLYISLGSIIF